MNKPKKKKNDNPPISQKQFNEAQEKAEEYEAGWKRALADYQNLQKDTEKRVQTMAAMASEDIVHDLLPIIDNFTSAFNAMPQELEDNGWVAGIQHIYNQIWDVLTSRGVEKISTIGEQFDPNVHESVEEVEAEGAKPGQIIEEQYPGYIMKEKVLRPARVKIAK